MLSSLPCFYAFCWSAIPTSCYVFNVFYSCTKKEGGGSLVGVVYLKRRAKFSTRGQTSFPPSMKSWLSLSTHRSLIQIFQHAVAEFEELLEAWCAHTQVINPPFIRYQPCQLSPLLETTEKNVQLTTLGVEGGREEGREGRREGGREGGREMEDRSEGRWERGNEGGRDIRLDVMVCYVLVW